IARCYRDEDFRADRQPEFTQLDVEMSFVDQEDVIALAEEILTEVWSTAGYEVQTPFPRMTYADAMRLYGSDKPDLRFDIQIKIARCYRDEDFRADRQPEFTQLDVEMSFVDQEDVIALAEEILTEVWSTAGYEVQTPFPRMTYADAMRLYGSDKPDLRFDIQITECTEFFKDTTFRVFQNEYVGAVVMDGGASQPRRQLDAWQEWAKQRGAKGLAYILVGEDGELSGPVAKNITDDERAGIADHVGAKPGDCIFFAAGDTKSSRGLLGAARGEIAQKLGLIDDNKWAFTWVVDAPMFEPAADARAEGDVALGNSAWTAVHHAFTSPKPEFLDSFDQDPGSALAYAYDIVCNGNEIGGGSIRIHQRDVQERVFQV